MPDMNANSEGQMPAARTEPDQQLDIYAELDDGWRNTQQDSSTAKP